MQLYHRRKEGKANKTHSFFFSLLALATPDSLPSLAVIRVLSLVVPYTTHTKTPGLDSLRVWIHGSTLLLSADERIFFFSSEREKTAKTRSYCNGIGWETTRPCSEDYEARQSTSPTFRGHRVFDRGPCPSWLGRHPHHCITVSATRMGESFFLECSRRSLSSNTDTVHLTWRRVGPL